MDISNVWQILFWFSQAPKVTLVGFGYLPPSWIKAALQARSGCRMLWHTDSITIQSHSVMRWLYALHLIDPRCGERFLDDWGHVRAALTHHFKRTGFYPSTWHMNVIITYTCHSDKMASPDPLLNCSRDLVLHWSCINYFFYGFLSHMQKCSNSKTLSQCPF